MATNKGGGSKQSVGGAKKMPPKMPVRVVPQRAPQKSTVRLTGSTRPYFRG